MRAFRLAIPLLLSATLLGEDAPKLVTGLGPVHHPTSTKCTEAQEWFDQGLAYCYAFNHQEAVRSFKKAVECDTEFALAWWGVGLALGPNINMDVDPASEKAAFEATQKAVALMGKASPAERDYVQALAKRYSGDPKADLKQLARAYKEAMGALARRHPDDLDAATLYAESAMDLNPWKLWDKEGRPTAGTEEIVTVLEGVLKRNPEHVGANHYYIHTVEASSHPERALPSAERLRTLAPAAGHLVHMPSHIFIRTGDYRAAIAANEAGAASDRAYMAEGGGGMYVAMYYSHNLHFLTVAATWAGREKVAMDSTRTLDEHIELVLKQMPDMQGMIEPFLTTTTFVRMRFHRWDELLTATQPPEDRPVTRAVWRFGRAAALAAKGQGVKAEAELVSFRALAKAVPKEVTMGLNPASAMLGIAELSLEARCAEARGDFKTAIASLRKAADAEDALDYDEPRIWILSSREALGTLLLRTGNAAGAERAYRDDLLRNPRSGRALFGLRESLRAQGNKAAVRFVDQELQAAWTGADNELTAKDL